MNIFYKIVATSLKYRYLVVFLAAVLMILGIGAIRNMPVDVFPEFAPPRVEIQTPSLGLSSAEVESLVTIPLEQVFAGTPGLDVMRSKSVNQLSSILLIFEPGTDLMEARQLVQERMAIATPQLPTWASPPFMLPPLSSTARTLKIGLSSEKYNLMELSMITYWKIRERLLRVPGVANVAIWGEQIEMLTVQVEPDRMAGYNVSMDEVLQVTSDTLDVGLIEYSTGSEVGAGGFLETPNQRMPIHMALPVVEAEDLANIPINERTKVDGSPLRLGDVAKTVMDTWPMIGDAVVNDGPGLLLIVEKFPWANTVKVTRRNHHGLVACGFFVSFDTPFLLFVSLLMKRAQKTPSLFWAKGTIGAQNKKSHSAKICQVAVFSGTPEGIRTPDPRLRRPLLYPAELLARECGRQCNGEEAGTQASSQREFALI